jgi:type II secretory pathway pseudopilin PulG
MTRSSRQPRGLTLLETLVTAAVLILGIGVVASTVVSIVRLNRRNLAQAQAYTIAEWWLERVSRMGCRSPNPDNPCADVRNLDNQAFSVFWNASGAPSEVPPPSGGSGVAPRPYQVTIDVDPPFEGTEKGDPAVDRMVATVTLKQIHNVRITVSWQDDTSGKDTHAVALQTRVGP